MKLYLTGSKRAQILLEILITAFLLTTFIGIGYVAIRESNLAGVFTKNYNRAQEIAQAEIENLRQLAKNNFDLITSTNKTINNYNVTINVDDIDAYQKRVALEVKWLDFFRREKRVVFDFNLTDWRSVQPDSGEGGATGGGGSGLTGNWSNPTTLESVNIGEGQGTDINVKYNTAFISFVHSDPKKDDLYIYDVSNPANPVKKSSLNTGRGVNTLSVKGNYAYLAHNSTTQQLQIVDISNENNPLLVRQITLPNNRSLPQAIFAFKDASTSKDIVIIGTRSSSMGKELFIYDVTNVNNPILISSYETIFGVTDIFVLKKRMYLTLSAPFFYFGDLPGVLSVLLVFDLSDIYRIQQLANLQFNLGEEFASIFPISYEYVFIGASQNLYLFKTSATTSGGTLNLIATEVDRISTGGVVNDIYAREDLAFLATANPNMEFQAINYSNKNDLRLYSSYNFPNIASGIDYRNNYVYLSVRSNDALRILTSR